MSARHAGLQPWYGLLLLSFLAAAGCGDDSNPGTPVDEDATEDASGDAVADSDEETGTPDVPADAPADTRPDSGPDTDTTPDPDTDTTPDRDTDTTLDPDADTTPDPDADTTPDPDADTTPDPDADTTPDPDVTPDADEDIVDDVPDGDDEDIVEDVIDDVVDPPTPCEEAAERLAACGWDEGFCPGWQDATDTTFDSREGLVAELIDVCEEGDELLTLVASFGDDCEALFDEFVALFPEADELCNPPQIGDACEVDADCPAEGFCSEDEICAAHTCGDGLVTGAEECELADEPLCVDCVYATDAIRHVEPDSLDAPFHVELEEGFADVLFALQPEGDRDFVSFTLTEAAIVRAETFDVLDAAGCAGDTILSLRRTDEARTVILTNDDKATGNLCSRVVSTRLSPGTYLVELRAFQDREAGFNRLEIEATPLLAEGAECPAGAERCAFGLDCILTEGTRICTANVCGDGRLAVGIEECDDGNDVDGDGCEDCVIVGIPVGNACTSTGFPCAEGAVCGAANRCVISGAPGDACDLAQETVVCAGTRCLPLGEDRALICTLGAEYLDIEPDQTVAEASVQLITTTGRAIGSLVRPDVTDLYVVDLERPARVTVRTSNGTNPPGTSCGFDTRLYRINPDVLTASGMAAAINTTNRLAYNDDDTGTACSLLVEELPAGRYYYVVDEFGQNADIAAYAIDFTLVERQPEGAVCDGGAVFGACDGESLYCSEAGVCTAHRCGDGVVGPEEQCDDGNDVDGDGCTACRFDATPVPAGGGTFNVDGIDEDGRAVFTFTTTGRSLVRIETSLNGGPCDSASGIDTILELQFADSGTRISFNDDAAGLGFCSRIETAVESGSYQAIVTGFGGDEVPAFRIDFTIVPLLDEGATCDRSGRQNVCDGGMVCLLGAGNGTGVCGTLPPAEPDPIAELSEVEPNNTVADAIIIRPAGADIEAAIDPAGDFDLYIVELDAPGTVEVFTSNGGASCAGLLDTRLWRVAIPTFEAGSFNFSNGTATALAYNDDAAGLGLCSRLTANLPAGRHLFVVAAYAGSGPGTVVLPSYRFSARITGGLDVRQTVQRAQVCDAADEQTICASGLTCVDENNNGDGRCQEVFPLVLGRTNPGTIPVNGARAYYFFRVDETVVLRARTEVGGTDLCTAAPGASSDTFLRVSSVGPGGLTQLASNDDGPSMGLCSEIARSYPPGDYVFTVSGLNDLRVIPEVNLVVREELVAGDVCPRNRELAICATGLVCVQQPAGDGVGVCGTPPLPTTEERTEVEPNGTAAEADAVGPFAYNVDVAASITAGDRDVFRIDLPVATTLEVFTSNNGGPCASGFDTELYRIDPAVANTTGLLPRGTSLAQGLLAYNDDTTGLGLCSRLSATLPAGSHYFLVKHYDATGTLPAYRFSARSPLGVFSALGDLCDAVGTQATCEPGLVCSDPDGDGDGICVAP